MKIFNIMQTLKTLQTQFQEEHPDTDARNLEKWVASKIKVLPDGVRVNIDAAGTVSCTIDISDDVYLAVSIRQDSEIRANMYKTMPVGYCNWCGAELDRGYHCPMCGGT